MTDPKTPAPAVPDDVADAVARAFHNLDYGDEFTAADLRAILTSHEAQAAELARLREALQRIADGRGVCGFCGQWATGEGTGVTACDCDYPHWTFPEPVNVARAALNPTGD